MKETSNRYALAALKERRATIDGEAKECEARLRQLNEALCHLDATLSIFDPEYDPTTYAPSAATSAGSYSAGASSAVPS